MLSVKHVSDTGYKKHPVAVKLKKIKSEIEKVDTNNIFLFNENLIISLKLNKYKNNTKGIIIYMTYKNLVVIEKTINNIDIKNNCSFCLIFNLFFDKANEANIKLSRTKN